MLGNTSLCYKIRSIIKLIRIHNQFQIQYSRDVCRLIFLHRIKLSFYLKTEFCNQSCFYVVIFMIHMIIYSNIVYSLSAYLIIRRYSYLNEIENKSKNIEIMKSSTSKKFAFKFKW